MARHDIKHIRRHIFTRHIPGIVLARRFIVTLVVAFNAANMQAFALAQGVESQALMRAQ